MIKHDLLHDSLGLLIPTILISPSYGPCPNFPACRHAEGHCRHIIDWSAESTSREIGRRQHTWASLVDARADIEAAGYSLASTPCNLYGDYRATHTATAVEIARQVNERAHIGTPCYVRYGRLPRTRRSHNYRDDCDERGVSVFRGTSYPDGRVEIHIGECPGAIFATARAAYLVTGREIGRGADGEPVLAGVRIVREIR
jgi:hypothetical protein